MTMDATTARLADDIRQTFATDPDRARHNIERLLQQRLQEWAAPVREEVLHALAAQFEPPRPETDNTDHEEMRRVFGKILGRDVDSQEMLSTHFLERLAQSLNTIFDSLNRLISVINMTFSMGAHNGDQTIRQFIGFHLAEGDQTQTLEAYLGQINAAFLTSHEAFKAAANTQIEKILHNLSPGQVARERSPRMKIGPLRKAEDFVILSEKVKRIQKWFESGRFMDDFLSEFEKNCEKTGLGPPV